MFSLNRSRRDKLSLQGNTKLIFIWAKLLSSPLESMCGLLAFILYKELHASPLQITLLISSKPIVALLSFYGNSFIQGNAHKLKSLITISTLISFLPFLLFPMTNSVWFFILAYAIFMMSNRAVIPAWSEILRINLTSQERGKVFSIGSTANYLANIVVPILISPMIDYYPGIWKSIFFILAIIHFFSAIVISFIRIKIQAKEKLVENNVPFSVKSLFIAPWKNSWSLIKERKDFRNFQFVFMLGGGGIMLMQPVFPVFFKQTLQLSYTELTLAISFCKGIGFAISSPIWARKLHQIPIHLFNSYVTCLAGIFAFLIIASAYQISWVYVAYLIYGLMQAGSELSWNLSGPIFSRDQDSTLFTGVNVAMVGLRGCFVPFLGELLFLYSNSFTVFACGGCLCLMGSVYSLWLNHYFRKVEEARAEI
jgi:hypothetical protein